ncbi:substrate-binding domain-containing protein [Moorella naiadis]|uniref:substrate-binding domain-containing protein n=1 Tax=Moorella naiadis (nom. illeg.) TaxID=3093670 RepID=UPI003D9C80EC
MNMKKIIMGLLVLVLALAFIGCGVRGPGQTKQEGNNGQQTAQKSGKKISKVGFTVMTMNNPFFVKMRDVARQELEKNGISMVEADPQFDPGKQLSAVEDFVNQGVGAIFLDPVDANAIVPAIKKANQAGIPVFTLDGNAAGGDIVSFVGTDNVQAGRIVGEYLAKRLNGKGKIAVIDYPLVTSCLERVQGLKEALANYPDIKIIAEQKGGTVTDALKVAETWMNQYKDLDAIFAINDPNALGALTAIENAKRQDHIFVVGIDGAKEAYDAMSQGRNFGATAAQFPDKMAIKTVDNLLKWAKGEQVEKETKIPTELITKDNIPKS